MITVTLKPGEAVRVEMHHTDGAFEVDYGESELRVTSDMPGSHLGREGLIHREVYAGCTCGEPATPSPSEIEAAARELQRWSWTLPPILRENDVWKALDRALSGQRDQNSVDTRCPEHGMGDKTVAS